MTDPEFEIGPPPPELRDKIVKAAEEQFRLQRHLRQDMHAALNSIALFFLMLAVYVGFSVYENVMEGDTVDAIIQVVGLVLVLRLFQDMARRSNRWRDATRKKVSK